MSSLLATNVGAWHDYGVWEMKGRYDALIDEGDKAETQKERLGCIWPLLKTVATNHLPTMEGKINKILWAVVLLSIVTLLSSKEELTWIWMAIMRLF